MQFMLIFQCRWLDCGHSVMGWNSQLENFNASLLGSHHFDYFVPFFIPESPWWLIAKGKIEDLKRDVKKTAKINRTEFPINVFNAEFKNSQRTENAELCEEKSSGKASLVDLFTPRPILFRTLCMFYNWLVTTLCYYGLTMTASNLSDDIFVNYILVVIVELPANIFCVYAMDKFGRKPLLTCSQIVAGITCIAAGLTTGLNPWIPV